MARQGPAGPWVHPEHCQSQRLALDAVKGISWKGSRLTLLILASGAQLAGGLAAALDRRAAKCFGLCDGYEGVLGARPFAIVDSGPAFFSAHALVRQMAVLMPVEVVVACSEADACRESDRPGDIALVSSWKQGRIPRAAGPEQAGMEEFVTPQGAEPLPGPQTGSVESGLVAKALCAAEFRPFGSVQVAVQTATAVCAPLWPLSDDVRRFAALHYSVDCVAHPMLGGTLDGAAAKNIRALACVVYTAGMGSDFQPEFVRYRRRLFKAAGRRVLNIAAAMAAA